MSVIRTIKTARGAHDIATTPDGRYGVVTNFWDESVSCVDLEHGRVTTIELPARPKKLAMSLDGLRAFVASHEPAWIAVVDTRSCETLEFVPDAAGAGQVESVALDPSGTRLYVARSQPATIEVLDVTSRKPALVTSRSVSELVRFTPSPLPIAVARQR